MTYVRLIPTWVLHDHHIFFFRIRVLLYYKSTCSAAEVFFANCSPRHIPWEFAKNDLQRCKNFVTNVLCDIQVSDKFLKKIPSRYFFQANLQDLPQKQIRSKSRQMSAPNTIFKASEFRDV